MKQYMEKPIQRRFKHWFARFEDRIPPLIICWMRHRQSGSIRKCCNGTYRVIGSRCRMFDNFYTSPQLVYRVMLFIRVEQSKNIEGLHLEKELKKAEMDGRYCMAVSCMPNQR